MIQLCKYKKRSLFCPNLLAFIFMTALANEFRSFIHQLLAAKTLTTKALIEIRLFKRIKKKTDKKSKKHFHVKYSTCY